MIQKPKVASSFGMNFSGAMALTSCSARATSAEKMYLLKEMMTLMPSATEFLGAVALPLWCAASLIICMLKGAQE